MAINKTCKCLIDGSMKLHPCSSNCHLFGDCISAFCKANVKPMTNADHIRAMSDEELAYELSNRDCPGCPLIDTCTSLNGCRERLLKWLQQPYKGE